MINRDRPDLWKADAKVSVDMYNAWFMQFAPEVYRNERRSTTEHVRQAFSDTDNLARITMEDLEAVPGILPMLRMATAPPIARDRLAGLSHTNGGFIETLERGALPLRMKTADVRPRLQRICEIISRLLDRDLFPWLERGGSAADDDLARAASVVADRLCGARADPIVRNAQERRQLKALRVYLMELGYSEKSNPVNKPLTEMESGTFSFRLNVRVTIGAEQADARLDAGEPFVEEFNSAPLDQEPVRRQNSASGMDVKIPVDCVIQPKSPRVSRVPLMLEAKSAGDFTNTNKRRKEEATKHVQLRATYGDDAGLILFLCGYFNAGYLGYAAADGIDWVWEHRIEDLKGAGL